MFGYININPEALDEQAKGRYQAFYCGLCRVLKQRHGNIGRVTLSYDMTFLLILLSSLYEPEEANGSGRCALHPVKERGYVRSEIADYVADVNIALAYHKGVDDWQDDKSAVGLAQAKLLRRQYARVERRYPEKCALIERCLREIAAIEKANDMQPDLAANLTASMLGELFVYRPDIWQVPLRKMGEELGRFIYTMDAYDDLPEDIEKRRYNPLIALHGREDFEELCKEMLTMSMAECTRAFEVLPLVQDADILRNVLYGGVWRKYVAVSDQRAKKKEGAA